MVTLIKELNPVVHSWLEQCELSKVRFAEIATDKASYDRVAIITDKSAYIVVEYPKQVRGKYKIQRDLIQRGKIVSLRFLSA